jgi:integrase
MQAGKLIADPRCRGSYSCKIQVNGRRESFPLRTANKAAAAAKAARIYGDVVSLGWDDALVKHKPEHQKPEKTATIGAWAEAVKATAGLRLSTFTTYLQSLRQIAAEIEHIGNQPVLDDSGKPKKDRKGCVILRSRFDYKKGGREAWTTKVDALPLSVLDAASVQRWKLRYIDKAGTAPDARRRAENSAATLLRCARSLFSAKARKFAEKELTLPVPTPFSEVEMPKRGNTAYQSKIDAKKLIDAARDELRGEPFKIFALGLLCGLRKREIDLLTWAQVDFDKALIRIERTQFFTPKSEDSVGEIDLDPELLTLLSDWKSEAKDLFVIESCRPPRHEVSRVNYRCEPHFKFLYSWLRQQGVTARKPLHELRKELGAILASKDGIFAAQSVLRHAQISTTASYYADKKKRITAGLGSLLKNTNT